MLGAGGRAAPQWRFCRYELERQVADVPGQNWASLLVQNCQKNRKAFKGSEREGAGKRGDQGTIGAWSPPARWPVARV